MDDEFKLCWKNFQDNIASGFQNLYDRGDLVDVTLACDGKLLHAHKIVLAICSPYFQEIFITNPCKHPIIILKDVTFNIMCELLEFMYQGVVNVKHTELQSFMKIGQLLQIKGLATNTSSSAASTSSEKSSSQIQNTEELNSASGGGGGGSGSGTGVESVTNSNAKSNSDADASNVENNSSNAKSSNACGGGSVAGGTSTTAIGQQRSHSPSSSPTPMGFVSPLTQQSFKSSTDSNTPTLHHPYHSAGAAAAAANMKRHSDISSDALSIYSRKQLRRSVPSVTDHSSEHNDSTDVGGMDQVNAEDFFLSAIPHISMVENRYDLNSVKRESAGDHHGPGGSTASLRNSFGPAAFSFDYNLYKNSSGGGGGSGSGAGGPGGAEFPNDLHMSSDYAKNFGNHMDIPQNNSGNVVMLSSTSLLHGQCVFNRNNTVATQQGMKTYWLCKSYRISMCRARCITHQGRVISATGVHNHAPHMSGNGSGGNGGSGGGGSGTGGNGSSRTNTGYGNDGQSQPMIGPNAAVIPTTNMTTPSGNIPTALMSGASNSNSNNSNTNMGRLHQSSLSSSNSNMYPPSTSLHGHSQHQQQQQHSQSTTPPPTINPLSSTHHAHALHHLPQSLPNLLVQHHSGMAMNSQTSLLHHHQQHHHHHHHQHQHSAAAAQNNSVIQNMMHSANIMNLPNIPQMMTTQQQHQQHSPHISDHQSGMVGSNLEITPLMQSSPQHMQSPSNHSNQSHHGGNSISSPIPPPPPGSSASAMKSPNQTNMSEDATVQHLGDQHLLVHNAAISPSEINSNTVGSAADAANASSQSDARNETPHQAHVIDSITISPGNVHNFKMEDM